MDNKCTFDLGVSEAMAMSYATILSNFCNNAALPVKWCLNLAATWEYSHVKINNSYEKKSHHGKDHVIGPG